MKLASGCVRRVNKWRRDRTLKRATNYRPIEADDVKYLWAAYKQGALEPLGEQFLDGKMSAEQFRIAFETSVTTGVHAAWTLFANTRKGFIPVGVIFAKWGVTGRYLEVIGITFLPWASTRNIVETCVAFFTKTRWEHPFIGYALPEHKRLYEVCAMHGIMRRVGTSEVVMPGKKIAVFETRTS